MQVKITKEDSLRLLDKISNLNLDKYYNFDEDEFTQNSLRNLDDLKDLLEEPKILKFFKDEETFKFEDENGEWVDINNFDNINNFDQTDVEISTRLFEIDQIFVNSEVGNVSKEMECFYLTINIAGVFGGRFKKNFLKTCDSYDFGSWEGKKNSVGEYQNFEQLYKNFQKVSTMKMRMLSSACSYKLKSKKKPTFLFSDERFTTGRGYRFGRLPK